MKLLRKCIAVIIGIHLLYSCATSKNVGVESPMSFPTTQNTLLWKISGNGIQNDCYVLGTMHLIEKGYFMFPESVQKKIKKSDRVIMEIANINQLDAMKYVMLEKGKITDFFNRKQLDTLYAWVYKSIEMDSIAFNTNFGKMKPFIISQITAQLSFSGPTESYEKEIQTIADNNKIANFGLETIAEQMSFFDKLTMQEQVEMVMAATRSEDNGQAETKKMMEVFKTQNIDQLYQLVHADKGVISANEDAFLADRNKRWIPKLKDHFTKGKCFVAVGAAHLGGPEGVLRLLQKEGYTLTPVKL